MCELPECPHCGEPEVDMDGWMAGGGETGPQCLSCGTTWESAKALENTVMLSTLRAENAKLRTVIAGLDAAISSYLSPADYAFTKDVLSARRGELMRDV